MMFKLTYTVSASPVYPDGQGPHLYPLALAGGGRSMHSTPV